MNRDHVFTHFHFCGGLGGAAEGMQRAAARVNGHTARAVCLGGVDSDPRACRDFKNRVGVEQACIDLFDRQMYEDFHGRPPPPSWHEATVQDIQRAAQGQAPDIVVISAPCKGFSKLIPLAKANSPKYLALNRLVLRCIHLALTAWDADPPMLFLIENVPGIVDPKRNGRRLLDQVNSLFRQAGYAAKETSHCAGEIGGLGQRRQRFLMVARHAAKVPGQLHEPPKRCLRTIGQVIGDMPPPNAPAGGPLHRLPQLKPITWLKLALIPAGKDHRALQGLDLRQYGLVIGGYGQHANKCRVSPWDSVAQTIIGADRVGSGGPSIADPRWGGGELGVLRLDEVAGAITGRAAPSTGKFSIADHRWGDFGAYRIRALSEVSSTITARAQAGSGPYTIADEQHRGRFNNTLRVVRWAEPGTCVTGGQHPQSGGASVADPRPWRNAGHYGVMSMNETAGCVTGASSHDNGKSSIADPRWIADLSGLSMPLLIAEDDTWHRPLTVLEKAALQGFDWQDGTGQPMVLDGQNQARWMERVGNAIPPVTMENIGGALLTTLLLAKLGITFSLSNTPVWVRPIALALTVDGHEVETC